MKLPIRPFRLIPSSTLSSLLSEVLETLHRWAHQWEIQNKDFGLSLQPFAAQVQTSVPGAEHLHFEAGEVHAWAVVPRDALRNLHTIIFGAPHSLACVDKESDYSWEAVRHARNQLLASIVTTCAKIQPGEARSTDSLPECLSAPGAGTLYISIDALALYIVVSGVFFQAPVSADPKTTAPSFDSLADLVQSHSIRLDVLAGTADIELTRLMELSPGDVILLDARVDEPLQAIGPTGTHLARCALGQSDGHRAIQLTP